MSLWKNNITLVKIFLCIFLGLLIGVVFFVCSKNLIAGSMERFYRNDMEFLQNIQINHILLLKDIIKIRGLQIAAILCIFLNKRKKFFLHLLIAGLSFLFLVQLLSCFEMCGVKGLVVFLGMGFPHYLIYLTIFIYIVYKNGKSGNNYEQTKFARKGNKVLNAASCLLEVSLLVSSIVLGILVECFCNPLVMKWIANIIV